MLKMWLAIAVMMLSVYSFAETPVPTDNTAPPTTAGTPTLMDRQTSISVPSRSESELS